MPADDWAKIRNEKKNSGSEFSKIKRDKEIEKEMEALGLNKEEYKEFLERRNRYKPELYDITLILDDVITGEVYNRLALFTSWVLAENCVYMEGVSSSGKSTLMDAVSSLISPSKLLRIDNASDKAIYEQRYDIENATYIIMNEVNKINPMMFEILKDWSEKKSSLYARAGGLGSNLEKIELQPKAFVFSKADESSIIEIPQELIYRLVEITVDGSQDQTNRVLTRKAQNIENPFSVKRVDLVKRAMLQYHIDSRPKNLIYVNPMGQKLIETIPTVFTSSRRDFNKFIDNINGISSLYYKSRMQVTIDDKEVQFITPADIALNQIVFSNILIKCALRCSDLDKIILQIIKDAGTLDEKDVQINLRKCSINTTVKNIKKHLDDLTDVGYLNCMKDRQQKSYSVSEFYKEFVIKPNFREIVDYAKEQMLSIEEFRPYADEYIQRYCEDDKLKMIDPFTGDVVDILTYDYSTPMDIEMDDTRLKPNTCETKINNNPSLDTWF